VHLWKAIVGLVIGSITGAAPGWLSATNIGVGA
jgi:hypothetical protein